MFKKIFIFCLVIAATSSVFSQKRKIDSLRSMYFSSVHDTVKLQALNDLIWPIYANNTPDSGIKYGHIAIELAEKNNALYKLIVAYRRLAICYTNIGNYKLGLKYHNESFDLATKLKSDKDIGIAVGNIGAVYMDLGDGPKALDYNLKSIELKERMKDYSSVQNNYYNVAVIYKDLGEFDKALEAAQKSVRISKVLKNDVSLGAAYAGLGMVYKSRKEYDKAQYHYRLAIEANLKSDNLHDLSNSLSNMGSLYNELKQYDSAIYYLTKSIDVSKKINFKSSYANGLGNLAFSMVRLKKYNEAIKYCKESIKADPDGLGNAEFSYGLLADSYREVGNFKDAYFAQTLRNTLRDSLEKINRNRDLVKLELKYDYDKRAVADSVKFAEQEKVNMAEVNVANARLEKEKTARYALIIGLIALCVFSYFIFTRFKLIQKQNVIIHEQRIETENQKHLIEEKQKEILDSINYAKRIQYALLASDTTLNEHLPEYFVFFKPKDVVSGDFYWATNTPEGFIYITADCTGHGVPGAFMSLLNISKLSETINEKRIYTPDKILNNVRAEIIAALNPYGSTEESKDGMDAVLCKLDLKKMKLQYSAANNAFYILRNNELIICKADKLSVGKGHNDALSFTFHEFDLKKGDTIYTFTDGYADQFGGAFGKKYKYKQLEELLIANSSKTMAQQKTILENSLEAWKGSLEQVDDVCIIGVRI